MSLHNKGKKVFSLQVVVLLIRQRLLSGLVQLVLVLGHDLGVDLDLRRSQGRSSDEFLKFSQHELADIVDIESGRHTKVGLPTNLRASHRKGFSKL